LLVRFPGITIAVYDPSSYPPPRPIPGITFHKRIVDLDSAVADAGGKRIEIFKIDCEGCEVDFFRTGLASNSKHVSQILLEVHWRFYGDIPERTASMLWYNFYKHGFFPFSKEPNIQGSDGSCVEYSMIHAPALSSA
jgi:hypothetical protein